MKPAYCQLLIATLLIPSTLPAQTVSQRWATRLSGSANASDTLWSIAMDAAGDIVCAGRVENSGTALDFHVKKLNGTTGAVQWSFNKAGFYSDGRQNVPDLAKFVSFAPDGSLYAGGDVMSASRSHLFDDWYLVKLNPVDGSVIWERAWGSTGTEDMNDMTTDSEGNVVMVGFLQGGAGSYKAIKVQPDGTVLWTRTLYSLSGATQYYSVTANRVAVDGANDIIISGLDSSLSPQQFWVTKISGATGARLWEWHTTGYSNSLSGGLTVDADGHVIFTTQAYFGNPTRHDLLTVKINASTGAEMWRNTYDYGAGGGSEKDGAVTVTPLGHVCVVGSSQETYDPNFGTGYYRMFTRMIHGQTGAELWTQRYPHALESFGKGVTVAPDGGVLALGYGGDARLIKYAAADGCVVWQTSYNGSDLDETIQTLNYRNSVIARGDTAAISVTSNGDWATVLFGPAPDTDNDGTPDATDPDDDNDGLPDAWELANGFDPLSTADAAHDADGDSQNNAAEYAAGTDPRDRSSVFLAVISTPPAPGTVSVSFQAVAGRSYTVRYKTDLSPGSPWTVLQHFPAQAVSGPLNAVDTPPPGAIRRFYQAVTPQQP